MASHKYGEIKYDVGFNIKTQDLQVLKKSLQEISNIGTSQYQLMNPNASKDFQVASTELKHIKEDAAQVQAILNKTFNAKLGISNISQFRNEINKMGIDKLYESFSKLGPQGTKAFNDITASLLAGNTQLRQTHKLLDSMATSFKNTVKWGISSAA